MGSLFHNFERGPWKSGRITRKQGLCSAKKNKPVQVQSSSKKNLGPFPTYPVGSNLKPIPFTMSQVQMLLMRSKPKLTYVPCPAWADLSYRIFGSFNHRATNAYWKNGGRSRGGPVNGFSASWWESHLVHSKLPQVTSHRSQVLATSQADKIIIVYIYGPLWYYTISLHTFHM